MSAKKKKMLAVIAGNVIVLIAVFLGASYFIGKQIVENSTQLVTNEETKNVHESIWAMYGFDYNAFSQAYTVENVKLTSSFDGHTIPADFIYSADNNNVVVMAHGLGGNRFTNYPLAEFFLENGFNIITYDQRSSGDNTAEKTVFGYWEKYDFIDCIQYAKERVPNKKIGVWGESFGGATAIQAVACEDMQEDIAFLILDCPVSSMEWMVEQEMKTMDIGVPIDYLTWCGSVVNKIELGFSYQEADSAEIAKKIEVPALVINSKADKITPYFMGESIYNNLASEKKEIWTVADSEHVGMWRDYNKEYRSKVISLINSK